MKIGIYAGTFDPVHNGHLEFTEQAVKAVRFDRVIMVAEKSPYRKKPAASWDHRQAMIERATELLPAVDHDYAFANQLAHQHTMHDMLTVAAKHYGASAEVWFLVGSDVYEHMHQWRGLVDQQAYGGFVVALRDDHTQEWLERQAQNLAHQAMRMPTVVIESGHRHVSSSAIRAEAGAGASIDTTPESVAQYIKQHSLYKTV